MAGRWCADANRPTRFHLPGPSSNRCGTIECAGAGDDLVIVRRPREVADLVEEDLVPGCLLHVDDAGLTGDPDLAVLSPAHLHAGGPVTTALGGGRVPEPDKLNEVLRDVLDDREPLPLELPTALRDRLLLVLTGEAERPEPLGRTFRPLLYL